MSRPIFRVLVSGVGVQVVGLPASHHVDEVLLGTNSVGCEFLDESALLGEKLVGLKMNVPEKQMEKVVAMLPSLNAPTVAHLYQTDWFSVEIMVDSGVVRDLIPQLLKNGVEGIIEYPLNKVV